MSRSPKQRFLALPLDTQRAYIDSLTDAEAHALIDSWWWTARPEQSTPEGAWTVWLMLMGRGSGKTRAAAEFIVDQVKHHGYRRVALVGRTAADVRDVMVTGKSGILAIARLRGLDAHHEPSKRLVTFGNGAIATTYSADAGDQLRGPEHDLAWADELAAWPQNKGNADAWANLMFGLRIGDHPRVVASTTPRPTVLIKQLASDPNTAVSRSSTMANADNLAPSFIEEIKRRYEGTRLWRQEVNGEVLDDVEGALWTWSMIEDHRVQSPPALQRIVIAVDPATTTRDNSDYTGVCVAGLGFDGDCYILHSEQLKLSPSGWASRVLALFDQYGADKIIAETNQGGQMVEHTIHSVNRNAPIKTIHASRGKQVRAEPVAALAEQGRIHHVGTHRDLEDQLVVFPVAAEHDDLVDSTVYAVTELADLHGKAPGELIIF